MTISVLMYHALYLDEYEFNEIAEEDRPYAISLGMFKQQLDLLLEKKIPVLSPDDFMIEKKNKQLKNSVLLTFDDGHNSFYKYAYPELVKRNIKGVFFVTTGLIDDRKNFCSWEQLKEMKNNGMCIQSHGKTHKFISDLDNSEANSELFDSKYTIEKKVKTTVVSISFPGGRFSEREIKQGIGMGYELFFTSKEGVNHNDVYFKSKIIKRLALRNVTNLSEFLNISKGNFFTIKKRVLTHSIKAIIKKIIGNNLYHVIYKKRRKN